MSLARKHFQRVTAAQVAASADPGEPIKANAYELQLIRLADAKRALKQVQSIERKAEVKRRVLPEFEPWIRGALEAGRGGQDDVLMTAMVWRIDVGDFPNGVAVSADGKHLYVSNTDSDTVTVVSLGSGTPVQV